MQGSYIYCYHVPTGISQANAGDNMNRNRRDFLLPAIANRSYEEVVPGVLFSEAVDPRVIFSTLCAMHFYRLVWAEGEVAERSVLGGGSRFLRI